MELMGNRNFLLLIGSNMISRVGSGITLIGVPWYLVTSHNGDQLLGFVTLFATILLFFVSPNVGVWVDRYSRKRLHRVVDFTSFLVVGSFACWGLFFANGYTSIALMGLYLAGELYFSFHYPTVFALTQEMFPKKWFGKINSVMEIQGQAASMMAGGLAGVLIQHWGLANILWVDAGTYLASFILYGFLQYERKARPKESGRKVTFLSDVQEGWSYLKERPRMIVFFLAAFMPFLVVLVTNYLFPVYVSHTLHSSAWVFAMYEVIFGLGAVMAGALVGLLNVRLGFKKVLILNASLFALAIFLIAFIPVVSVFLVLQAVLGWGNAGIRINRKTLMMEEVPNHLIGRVNSFYASVGIAVRVALIGAFTLTVSHTGASFSVIVLGVILVFAITGIIASRNFSGVKVARKRAGSKAL